MEGVDNGVLFVTPGLTLERQPYEPAGEHESELLCVYGDDDVDMVILRDVLDYHLSGLEAFVSTVQARAASRW